MTRSAPIDARPYCYRCDKPESMCLCAHLTPIANTVCIHVLQHPAERRHAIGTARIVRLGLASAQVHVMEQREGSAATKPVEFPPGTGLLYPSPEARELDDLPAEERPKHLVVIDGTWAQAHRLYRDNTWISDLPQYRLSLDTESRYRIRKEPRFECVSTVEAVAAALRCLEPDLVGIERLDSAFDAMIDAQIVQAARPSLHKRFKRPRKRAATPVPAVMLAPNVSIVVVFAEAEPPLDGDTGLRGPVRISAVGLDSGNLFDSIVQTRARPDGYLLENMGIHDHQLTGAPAFADVLSAFQRFCQAEGSQVVLTAWNPWTHRWLSGLGQETPNILLKGVWANMCQERVQGLANLVAHLDLQMEDLPIDGRAGVRLAQAQAMAKHIVQSAPSGS